MSPLQRITERVTRLGDPENPSTPRPLVTVDEFFSGNDVVGSIGCNLASQPRPDEFYVLFREISQRRDVKDVRVKITAFDMAEWPFSDTVYIMTSAPLEEVQRWFPDRLRPDEFWEGFLADEKYEPYQIPAGVRPVAAWWD